MNIQVEVRSLNTSKNSADFTAFKKYDVEISINETENTNDHSTLQYTFIVTSNPKNARFAIEGTAKLIGTPEQRDEILSKTEGSVPIILTSIYQELFPTLFIISKSLNIPSPPYRIGGSQMTESPPPENPPAAPETPPPAAPETPPPSTETPTAAETPPDTGTQNDMSENTANDGTSNQNTN